MNESSFLAPLVLCKVLARGGSRRFRVGGRARAEAIIRREAVNKLHSLAGSDGIARGGDFLEKSSLI